MFDTDEDGHIKKHIFAQSSKAVTEDMEIIQGCRIKSGLKTRPSLPNCYHNMGGPRYSFVSGLFMLMELLSA